jgi:signal transduction histidine kinase
VERIQQQCIGVAAYIRQSRDEILAAWQDCVAADPELTTASSISHTQFTDSIPKVLDAFEHALRADDALRETQADLEQREGASEHGLHRWQQGYDLRETMREWAHLHRCILAQLESYTAQNPSLPPAVMQRAREALVRLCGEGACESAARYTRLQQAEAAGRMRDLEAAVQELRALERNRADILRQAAHDLRGSVGVITNATAVLARTTSEEMRTDFYGILDRAIGSTQTLLSDLIDLTRLEAGQDRLQITAFDVSELLRDLSESLRVGATARNLFFRAEGPESLQVRGDRVKLQRIVQNLVLNALKATASGGVRVAWQAPQDPAGSRWLLTVQDTGSGLRGVNATPLTRALREATDQAHESDARSDHTATAPPLEPGSAPERESPRPATVVEHGEGIGLSIVKRLCELLGAGIELESEPGQGTVFRLSFPMDVRAPQTQPPGARLGLRD